MSVVAEAMSSTLEAPAPPSSPAASSHTAKRRPKARKFLKHEGSKFICQDGSRWKILQALSPRKLQQDHAPCEARQVFSAICDDDPLQEYADISEAVVKIRFQICGSRATTVYYEELIAQDRERIERHPHRALELEPNIERYKKALQGCNVATHEPNQDTMNELLALRRLYDHSCASAPWILNLTKATVRPRLAMEGVVGGYNIFLLMTKVPGEGLSLEKFCKYPLAERGEIRAKFREALTNVWNCGIVPRDTAARNVVWDEIGRRCYIVDFEDCWILDLETEKPPCFEDMEYYRWDLSESVALEYRGYCGWNKETPQ